MALNDLRHGVRLLRNNPGFALIAIASIAIGVGANAAIFSFADGLLLRPLGIARAGEVLSVVRTTRETAFPATGVSYPDFADLRDRARTFERLVASRNVLVAFDARPDQPALRTLGAAVTGDLFAAIGVRPALGRFFTPLEDRVAGRDAVLVLDHRTWTERFGADPAAIGRRVRVANIDFTVVGVSPADFRGLDDDVWPTFYVPMAMVDAVQRPAGAELTRRDVRAMDVKGFLADGATLDQARQEIAGIGVQLASEHQDLNRGQGLTVRTQFQMRMTGRPDSALVVMLFALAMIVLLVACANVAGLLTSRAPLRAREIALRMAIGAGRARLLRQLIVESLLIAIGGAAVGLVIAYGGILLFRRIEFPTEVPLKLYFSLDLRVILIGLGVATASAILSSLIPAWQTTRTDLVSTIRGSAATGHSRQWGRHGLVGLQVALSLVLVTVAAGFHAGFRDRMLGGPGYRTDRLLLMRFDERLAQYDAARASQFYRLVKERAAALPGVESVALTSSVPMKTDTSESMRVAPAGVRLPNDAADVVIRSSRVDEGFFDTLGIPLLAGRAFTASDTAESPRVVVVNQVFAERYWPGGRAVGQQVRVRQLDDGGSGTAHEIVGVARVATYDWLGEQPQEFVYLPRAQSDSVQNTLLVETDSPEALAGAVRDVVRGLDPDMPMFSVRTMEDLYQARGIEVPNVIVRTVAGLGAMGIGLALVGLYGLVSYAVNRRTREIGIRMAVGAAPLSVLAMVLRRALVLTSAGLLLGGLGSAAAAKALDAGIPGVGNFGPLLYAIVIPAVFGVAALAAYIPARRAARIDPLRALRME